ncbi:MAG: class II fructose-bisphosphatase [Culicoidibacterales bacterium]
MKRELALEFSRVTEDAAIAAFSYIGNGNKNAADEKAVTAMREMFNQMDISGEVVIGEGEIDEAPMLYIGEKVGKGGDAVDIAVDPIDGTRMVAMGQDNAVAILAAGEKGSFLKAPDMYMEKLVVNEVARGKIDITKPLLENLKTIAEASKKSLSELCVMTLAKERNREAIQEMQSHGIKVLAIPDGDVAATLLVCLPEKDIDAYYGIGGAPEGVISAALVRALDGDMEARLLLRNDVKGDTDENKKLAQFEKIRCQQMGVEPNTRLVLDDLVKSDNVIFSATGITGGALLSGVEMSKNKKYATTETLLIRGKTGTIRRIHSTHLLEKKYR